MVFYKQQKGSPWINNFAEAERWVNEEENKRLNLDNIERPKYKMDIYKIFKHWGKSRAWQPTYVRNGPIAWLAAKSRPRP